MTSEEKAAIRARCEAASPRPWFSKGFQVRCLLDKRGNEPVGEDESFCVASTHSSVSAPLPEIAKDNADFIAHAPDDIPALLAALEAAEAELATITCAFCGHKEPRGDNVPLQMATHIADCKEHPMRAAVLRVQELEAEIAAWREGGIDSILAVGETARKRLAELEAEKPRLKARIDELMLLLLKESREKAR